MQDRITQIDKSSCTARPDHTYGSISDMAGNSENVRCSSISGQSSASRERLQMTHLCHTWLEIIAAQIGPQAHIADRKFLF